MKILISGATGLLGKALLEVLSTHVLMPCSRYGKSHELESYLWENLDITNDDAMIAFANKHGTINNRPDIIIHCAAIGSVDKVQIDFVDGLKTNLLGTQNIIALAKILNTKLIFISTNAVFDGLNPPYNEDAPLCPVSNYGIIKATAELAVRSSGLDWMIFRPILMYGQPNKNQRGNWVTIWLDKLKKNETCLVVDDVITQPLYSIDCANMINKAIELNAWGHVFNAGGGSRLSLYDFAKTVVEVFHYDEALIKPVPSSYFASIAPRPPDTSYNLTKIMTMLKHTPMNIYDGLKALQSELYDAECKENHLNSMK